MSSSSYHVIVFSLDWKRIHQNRRDAVCYVPYLYSACHSGWRIPVLHCIAVQAEGPGARNACVNTMCICARTCCVTCAILFSCCRYSVGPGRHAVGERVQSAGEAAGD